MRNHVYKPPKCLKCGSALVKAYIQHAQVETSDGLHWEPIGFYCTKCQGFVPRGSTPMPRTIMSLGQSLPMDTSVKR